MVFNWAVPNERTTWGRNSGDRGVFWYIWIFFFFFCRFVSKACHNHRTRRRRSFDLDSSHYDVKIWAKRPRDGCGDAITGVVNTVSHADVLFFRTIKKNLLSFWCYLNSILWLFWFSAKTNTQKHTKHLWKHTCEGICVKALTENRLGHNRYSTLICDKIVARQPGQNGNISSDSLANV